MNECCPEARLTPALIEQKSVSGKLDRTSTPKSRLIKVLSFGNLSHRGGCDHRTLSKIVYAPTHARNHPKDRSNIPNGNRRNKESSSTPVIANTPAKSSAFQNMTVGASAAQQYAGTASLVAIIHDFIEGIWLRWKRVLLISFRI